jgi:DnaJ-class molecular chaperone
MPDLYEILGVDRKVDADALRSAYRRIARENHPDQHPGDAQAEERFKQASHAYAVLSDDEKRRAYDEFGDAALEAGFDAEAARRAKQAFQGSFARGEGFEGTFSFDDLLGGLFDRFGGQGGRNARAPRAPRSGRDLRSTITLDFLDAANGGEHRIQVARPTADGRVVPQVLTVRIPPGVRDGGTIRLSGKGEPAPPGGRAGNLHLEVSVRPHPVFRREGNDVHLDLPVTVREAALGAKIEIPTLEGRATVTVPAGTQGGAKLRLRGKGIPKHRNRAAGDLIATVRIAIPTRLDDEARAALEALAACDDPELRAKLQR